MDDCIKTGFVFRLDTSPNVYVGDLYIDTSTYLLYIKGIPRKLVEEPSSEHVRKIHAEIAPFIRWFDLQDGGYFYRTKPGKRLTLSKVSEEFREHMEKYYPDLWCYMPWDDLP